eukprot:GHVR01059479.1.p1 GENE.GHVR01059479.1~~GHVR01059479.1.p1  ORF type:complete len:140 (+),score=31.95 GHVR01059479.1:121-540(+)
MKRGKKMIKIRVILIRKMDILMRKMDIVRTLILKKNKKKDETIKKSPPLNQKKVRDGPIWLNWCKLTEQYKKYGLVQPPMYNDIIYTKTSIINNNYNINKNEFIQPTAVIIPVLVRLKNNTELILPPNGPPPRPPVLYK